MNVLTVHLDDYCERGEAWRLWTNNPVLIDRNDNFNDFIGTSLQWRNYEGRWGNIEKLVSMFVRYTAVRLKSFHFRIVNWSL